MPIFTKTDFPKKILNVDLSVLHELFFAVLLCIVILSGTQAYADGGDLSDAYDIYRSGMEEKGNGAYTSDGLLFIVSEIEIEDFDVSIDQYEGEALFQSNDQLVEYAISKLPPIEEKNTLYGGKLGKKINSMLSNLQELSLDFTDIPIRVLENGSKSQKYRRVIALDEQEVVKAGKAHLSNLRNQYFAVWKAFEKIELNGDHQTLIEFYLEAGLLEHAILQKSKFLAESYHLTNYYRQVDIFSERASLRRILSNHKKGNLDAKLLKKLPGNYEILTNLSNTLKPDDFLGRIVLNLFALPDSNPDQRQTVMQQISLDLKALSNSYSSLSNMKNYLSIGLGAKIGQKIRKEPIVKQIFLTMGHLNIDQNLPINSTRKFRKAKQLFNKGVNLDDIITLLVQSTAQAPRHLETWNYLGAALKAKGYKEAALAVNLQGFQLDPSNIETIASLTELYQILGYKTATKNYLQYLKIVNSSQQKSSVTKSIQRITKNLGVRK
jgi:tetratricopeptide (TPR) repeat protein